jgi:hypothetical protein
MTALVTLMSGLPVFRPLLLLTLATIWFLSYGVNSALVGRPLFVKALAGVAIAAGLSGTMYRPLMEQYRREQVVRFELKPNYAGGAVLATATGRIQRDGPQLRITADSIAMTTRPSIGEATIDYVRFGIARWDENYIAPEARRGNWHITAFGQSVPVGVAVRGNEARSLFNVDSAISVDQVVDLPHSWLVLEVGVTIAGTTPQSERSYSLSDLMLFHEPHGPRPTLAPSPNPSPLTR